MSDKLNAVVEASATDPFKFEELVDTWNQVFENEAMAAVSPELDRAVDSALIAISAADENDVIGPRLRYLLNALPHASFAVRSDGIVTAMNETAIGRLTIDPGDHVDAIGYGLDRAELLSDVIRRSLDPRANTRGEVALHHAVHLDTDRSATLAVIPSLDGDSAAGTALVFVIDPVWRADVAAIMTRAYQLTEAEGEILAAFLEGHDLRDISAMRDRSHATVRTQFQTIMNKAGASSQAELMRNMLAISQFFKDVDPVAQTASHPHRKRFDLLGAGGRGIDVTLAGDLSGRLIVYIPDTTQCLFPAWVEARFRSAGLCVASLCRPGCGRTDPPLKGAEYNATLAQDIVTLQDQLGRETAVLWAHNTSSTFGYAVGTLIPDRLSRIVQQSTLVPAPLFDPNKVRSPWVAALMRAIVKSPGMYRLVIRAAIRAWKAMGSRRLYAMQLRGHAPDVALLAQTETVAELDHATRTALAQSFDFAGVAFEYAMRDWSDWVRDSAVPIELIQGHHDGISNIDTARRFAAAFPDKIKLTEIPDGGFLTSLTHTDVLIDRLSAS
ncbi:alpha/beta fold hydrolase [Gymnodinialimonas sp. 2305UL16-5]|uniref:alpha/beta fold hydrolase n=1 Tax=Gymnodinialimonas mytili TaxID=3126503 RepID=UPI0030A1FB6B